MIRSGMKVAMRSPLEGAMDKLAAGVRFALNLDFAGSDTLDPLITFTRASSGTYTDSTGVLRSAAVNLLTYSEQFDNAAWVKSNATITANTIVAPDGALTGDKLVENTASSTHFARQTVSGTTNANALTYTVYVKAGGRTSVRLAIQEATTFTRQTVCVFNLSTGLAGTPNNIGGAGSASASMTAVGNGWYRCTLTTTLGGSDSNVFAWIYAVTNVGFTYTGDGTSGIFIWGAQLEAGAFATSYMGETTSSQITRAADFASMTGTNFSDWFNAADGTLYAEYSIPYDSSASLFPVAASFNDGTFANAMTVFVRTVDDLRVASVRTSGVVEATISNGSAYVYGEVSKSAFAYKANDIAHSVGGAAAGTDVLASIPVVDRLTLGESIAGSLSPLNGHIRSLAYYPTRLPNTQLQALTL
jgi:hypothetical protein